MRITYALNMEQSLIENMNALADFVKETRKDLKASGFWFDFGGGEHSEWKRWGKGVRFTGCYFMAQAARDSRKAIVVTRNMNGQVLVRLAD